MSIVDNANMNLEIIENAVLMEDVDTTKTRLVKVYIPKLMPPTVPIAYDSTKNINTSMILNDPNTIPHIRSIISTSNYITIPLATNVYLDTKMYRGKHLDVYINNKNIKNMRVINMGGDELD